MSTKKAVKVNPHDVEAIPLSQRVNYKLIDPTTVGSQHLTFGSSLDNISCRLGFRPFS